MPVQITALYVALHAVLLLILAVLVMLQRGRHKVGLGDGGQAGLAQAIRAHGNAVEYVPIALLLLLVYELNGGNGSLLHTCGIVLLASRIAHAWGLSRSSGESIGRAAGVVGTFLVILVLVGANLLRVL
ncbi:MAG TPA: MAPEG family protein [Burkholderiaceae bacterium]|nr:MAPEG family protein [Burkholderiaceae bacterium]